MLGLHPKQLWFPVFGSFFRLFASSIPNGGRSFDFLAGRVACRTVSSAGDPTGRCMRFTLAVYCYTRGEKKKQAVKDDCLMRMRFTQSNTSGCESLLRQPAEGWPGVGPGLELDDQSAGKTENDDNFLLCKQCRHRISHASERVRVQGAHRHTFVNPQGFIFEIGCFANAPGCRQVGLATDDFSWFKGRWWKIAVCGNCRIHIGWLYLSTSLPGFYGLILDRITGG